MVLHAHRVINLGSFNCFHSKGVNITRECEKSRRDLRSSFYGCWCLHKTFIGIFLCSDKNDNVNEAFLIASR